MRLVFSAFSYKLFAIIAVTVMAINSDDPIEIDVYAEGGHTVSAASSVPNSSGMESYCEMRYEGNRSSFCCFKGNNVPTPRVMLLDYQSP